MADNPSHDLQGRAGAIDVDYANERIKVEIKKIKNNKKKEAGFETCDRKLLQNVDERTSLVTSMETKEMKFLSFICMQLIEGLMGFSRMCPWLVSH